MKKIILPLLLLTITLNGFSQVYPFDSIPDKMKSRADAVVRTEQFLFTITGPGNAVEKMRKAVTLLNENADDYRLLTVMYDKYDKVKYVRGTIYDEKGNLIKILGVANVFDMSAMSGGTFYSDDRMKIMYFPLYKYPYTIVYEYEIEHTSLLNYPSWNFQDSPDVSVQKSGIQFVLPRDMKLRYYEEYMNTGVDSVILEDKKIYTWQEENLPAFQSQDFSIKRVYNSPSVHTAPLEFEFGGYKGSMRSWNEFGTWVYDINKDRDALPQSEIDAIREAVSKTSDLKEKVRLVYEFMQSRTRYVSIQIGIGGYRTEEASAVVKNGFGDCKALVNYTSALLKAVGINSFRALILAEIGEDINPGFVNNEFNHVILCVPLSSDTVWLECTNQTSPFNYLGSSTTGKSALVLTSEGGKLVKTPEIPKGKNLEIRTGSFFMNILGTSTGNISNFYSGYNFGIASSIYSLDSEDEIKRTLNSGLRFTDFSVTSVNYSEDKSGDPSARLAYQLNIRNFATTNGSRMYFNPVISVQDYLQDFPVHLIVPVSDIIADSIVYNLPLNYIVEYIPEDVSIENEFGKFTFNLEAGPTRIVFRRRLELNESDITSEKYEEFRTFINSIAKTDREKIILIRSDV